MDGPDNVLVVNFKQDAYAYEALTQLKLLDAQGQIGVRSAGVVVREADGKVALKDQVADDPFEATATGGIIGPLIGIVGGRLGILVGGPLGLVDGFIYDVAEEEHAESVLGHVSRSMRVGRATLPEVEKPKVELRHDHDRALSGATA